MRGKQGTDIPLIETLRITPADAGKTRRQVRKRTDVQDHPRGCGENRNPVAQKTERAGSPPRMRGKPTRYTANICMSRITPADAGKTEVLFAEKNRHGDHPRGCGENWDIAFLTILGKGSPPRMRGKRQEEHGRIPHKGITPADAGKTRRMVQLRLHFRDHPRGCGENAFVSAAKCYIIGSPPRMRGKRVAPQTVIHICGITPADAGKTTKKDRRRIAAADHPRGCGENPSFARVTL